MDEQVDDNLEKKKARDLILSAPLFYSNDVPHIGHFLTMTAVDLMRKILILFSQTLRKSRHICFLAGVDEHGKKIENTALKKGKKPHEFVEGMNNEFISI